MGCVRPGCGGALRHGRAHTHQSAQEQGLHTTLCQTSEAHIKPHRSPQPRPPKPCGLKPFPPTGAQPGACASGNTEPACCAHELPSACMLIRLCLEHWKEGPAAGSVPCIMGAVAAGSWGRALQPRSQARLCILIVWGNSCILLQLLSHSSRMSSPLALGSHGPDMILLPLAAPHALAASARVVSNTQEGRRSVTMSKHQGPTAAHLGGGGGPGELLAKAAQVGQELCSMV